MSEETKDNQSKNGEDASKASSQAGGAASSKPYPLPKIDFSTFVLSINSSALVQLGLLEDPASGQKTKNLALAKQTIDLLAMLEEKTKNNLSSDEDNILKNILYELRILYIKEKG